MKRIFAAVLLLASFAANAQATAYFYCDTVLTVGGQCGIFIDALPKVINGTVVIGGIQKCRYDVTALSVGTHTLNCSAIAVNDPKWGSQESAPDGAIQYTVPPPTLSPPTNLKVGP